MSQSKLAIELKELFKNNFVEDKLRENFLQKIEEGGLTKKENPKSHFCVYFAAYDPRVKQVFIGHHKKSGLWLFNGAHIEQGEMTKETLIREIGEEWGLNGSDFQLEKPAFLTTSKIDNPTKQPCNIHFDLWYFLNLDKNIFAPVESNLLTEFHEYGWKTLGEARILMKGNKEMLSGIDFIERNYFVNEKYLETLDVYERMGNEYIKAVNDIVISSFSDFMKLLPKKGIALDVGCAGGRDSKLLTQRGFEVIGIDLVDVFLKYARENVPEAKFLKMDVMNLDFPADKFDVILANAVLLHLEKEDAVSALENLHKILKPKGKIFIGVKKGTGRAYSLDEASNKKRLFVYYEEDEITKLLTCIGFKVIFLSISEDGLARRDTQWIMIAAEK